MKRFPKIGLTTMLQKRNSFVADWIARANNYDQSVFKAGGIPVSITSTLPAEMLDAALEGLDGIIFIGGPDIPPSYYGEAADPSVTPLPEIVIENHLALVRKAFDAKLPVLGICLGMQELNVASGGKLIQDLGGLTPTHRSPEQKDAYHPAIIEPGSRLAEIFGAGEIRVNSCHHQAVLPAGVAKGAKITAFCGDVVEAIEFDGDIFRIGVQWHPERIDDEAHRQRFFAAFLSECRGSC